MDSARAIFVVCTSDDRRARTAALLRRGNHPVREVAVLDGLVAAVAAERPPLLVFDFATTDEAALDLCRQIRRATIDTFILQLSPRVDGLEPADGAIDALLIDPIDDHEMLTLVRSLLRLQQVEADLRDSEDRLQLAQDSAGLAILDWQIPTNTFVRSGNLLELFGLPPRPPEAPLGSGELVSRIHPDDMPGLVEQAAAESARSGLFDKEYRLRLDDGSIRWIASRGRFFSNAAGKAERMVSLSFDVTARKEAEHANAVLASIVASSTDAIVSIDPAGTVTSWNKGAERLFGEGAAAMVGRSWISALGVAAEPACSELSRRVLAGEPHEVETSHAPSGGGAAVDIWISGAPIRAADGRTVGASLIMRDVSTQKQREEHVRFLMRELTHRSKNLLAVIQAMARQSLSKDITPAEFVSRFTQRLAGLAGSHDLLSSVEWKGASLMELINSQLNHYEELFGTRILLMGEDLLVRAEAAQNIGVALHELSTNAAKYGALSNNEGQVTIAWTVHENASPPALVLCWRESGGPPVVAPRRRGFGSIVMDRIAGRALDGRSAVVFEPEGVVWTMEVPLASAVVSR